MCLVRAVVVLQGRTEKLLRVSKNPPEMTESPVSSWGSLAQRKSTEMFRRKTFILIRSCKRQDHPQALWDNSRPGSKAMTKR